MTAQQEALLTDEQLRDAARSLPVQDLNFLRTNWPVARAFARALESAVLSRQAGVQPGWQPTPMVPASFGGSEPEFRMDAYYYSFDPTGVLAIDLILSAVACAGMCFHHTGEWREKVSPYHDRLRGESPIEWIQNAANDAAAMLKAAPPPPSAGKDQE